MKKLVVALAIGLVVSAGSSAQVKSLTYNQILKGGGDVITRQLPVATGWVDNNTYILSERREGLFSYKAVDLKTGKVTSYAAPKENSVQLKDGDIYYLSSGGVEKRLTGTREEEKNPTLSPDGKWVAFTRNNDLYAVEIETGKEVRYTTDGSDLILNGWASWVYYEEILGRPSRYRAFWWSPDSKHIAFFRSDDSKVPMFPLYNSEGQHGFLEETRYPKAGDPNPDVKVGVVKTEGGKVVWAGFNEKDDQYFGQPFWTPQGDLWLQWMPRSQDNLKLYAIDKETGAKKEIYTENQQTWVDWIEKIQFAGNGFFMVRDFDGWEQIYYHNMDGKLIAKLTDKHFWGTSFVNIDEKAKIVYFTSRGEISTRYDFYSVKFDGKNLKRLSFGNYNHQGIQLSPDRKHFITSYSNVSTPTKIAVVSVADGKIVKEIADSRGTELHNYVIGKNEMVWIQTSEGFKLPATIMYPVNFNKDKKYPVLINVYGGPNAGSVMDSWKGMQNQLFAKEGIIQITIDHRGSGHCGKNGMNYMHRNLGKWEMADYIQWVKWLYDFPYVNRERIGITGGSYGGFVTAMALTYGSEYFNYGIADFGVMAWELYDSHYTERYMDAPAENPEGYKNGCVMNYVSKYKGGKGAMLRVVHGTMDDNVHMQNSIQLIDALEEATKEFEFMLYPGGRHGWGGNKAIQKRNETWRFWYRHLLQREAPDILFE